MQIVSLIGFNITHTNKELLYSGFLFVAAFVLTLREKAFYVRIVGAMGIKSVDGLPRRDAGQRT